MTDYRGRITRNGCNLCIKTPFYIGNRLDEPYESSSGIDLNQYEFSRYENFGQKCNCKEKNNVKNNVKNNTGKYVVLSVLLILIILYMRA